MRWIGLRRSERPDAPLVRLVDEASRRFDLSPLEEQFLMEQLQADQPGARAPETEGEP
ncbi:MAG TPA: hypothetical protein VGK67_30940 [Myxococcales bacterium]